MDIFSAQFVKGIVGPDELLDSDLPQVAFIGRSNAGKSSIINFLTKQKNLARTSALPGRTQEVNLFLINDSSYFVDLPGYGFAKVSKETRSRLKSIIHGYLFESSYNQKNIVLLIDAKTGPTKLDIEMLLLLEHHKKNIVVVANKIDKVKRSEYKKQLAVIQELVGPYLIIPFSAEKKIGRSELLREIL